MANEAQLQLVDSGRAPIVDQQIEELQKITDYEIKEWPIEVLVEKFTNGRENDESEVFIPDYQREMVWTPKQQSRFIESILIKLPVPFIFAADVWAAAGFMDTLLRCEVKSEVGYGDKTAIQPGVQS